MTKINAEETVKAKNYFERLDLSYDVNVSYYHANNALFNTNLFWSSITSSNQTMSFCGINTHH